VKEGKRGGEEEEWSHLIDHAHKNSLAPSKAIAGNSKAGAGNALGCKHQHRLRLQRQFAEIVCEAKGAGARRRFAHGAQQPSDDDVNGCGLSMERQGAGDVLHGGDDIFGAAHVFGVPSGENAGHCDLDAIELAHVLQRLHQAGGAHALELGLWYWLGKHVQIWIEERDCGVLKHGIVAAAKLVADAQHPVHKDGTLLHS